MTKRAYKVRYLGKAQNHAAAVAKLAQPGDAVIVDREGPRLLVMRCPCSCGDNLLVNLDKRSGPAWRIYLSNQEVTLYPSYWRDGGCGSHFILWANKIYWCYGWQDTDDYDWRATAHLEQQVLEALPVGSYTEYEYIADQLDEIPWMVLQACRQLAQKGCVQSRFHEGRWEFFREEPSR